jgi:hypothetical protein
LSVLRRIGTYFVVAAELFRDIFVAFRRQSLSRGYLLALAIFVIALFFGFMALSPLLASFVYPLF